MAEQICMKVSDIPFFIKVTPENKDEVIKFLAPWDIADILFSTDRDGGVQ